MVKDFVKLSSNQDKLLWLVFVIVTRLVEAQCGRRFRLQRQCEVGAPTPDAAVADAATVSTRDSAQRVPTVRVVSDTLELRHGGSGALRTTPDLRLRQDGAVVAVSAQSPSQTYLVFGTQCETTSAGQWAWQ